MKYEDVIEAVPKYEDFLTVDELNESSRMLTEKHPDLVKFFQIGKSTCGEPIYTLKVGEGESKAILIGFPHPNEPVGSLTIEFFSKMLVENKSLREQLNFTWYFIKVADVDGARLNEGWFKGRYENVKYVLNLYRPPTNKQVDRNFPIEYKTLKWDKPIPETKAIMNLIDRVKPNFIFSLHNDSFSGVYFYVSEICPSLYPKLKRLAISQNLHLHMGEPYPYFQKLDDGVFHMPVEEVVYDYLEKYSGKDPATIRKYGAGVWDYAMRVSNTFTIICEVPYIFNEKISDKTPTTITKRMAVLRSVETSEEIYNLVKERYDRLENLLDPESSFYDVVTEYIKCHKSMLDAKKNWAETNRSLNVPATVSEVFEKVVIEKYKGLEMVGQFIRLLDESIRRCASEKSKLQKERSLLLMELKRLNKEANKDTKFEVVPIQKLVRIQVGTALHAADFISHTGV